MRRRDGHCVVALHGSFGPAAAFGVYGASMAFSVFQAVWTTGRPVRPSGCSLLSDDETNATVQERFRPAARRRRMFATHPQDFPPKWRQMKTAAIFELVNPMPRLSFKRKSGYRKPPWPVFVFQLALAAFVKQSVRRPSATGAPPLRQHGAFLQTFRAHLLFRRKHRPTAART